MRLCWLCDYLTPECRSLNLLMRSQLPAPAPPTPPAPPAGAARQQSNNNKQQYRTDRGIDDRADHSGTQVRADPWQQPMANERTNYPYKKVANNPEPRPSYDLAC